MEGATFQGVATEVRLALNNGHQGLTDHMWGISKYDPDKGLPVVTDVVLYKAECIMPPDGVGSVEWIKGGMKGAQCD